MHVELECFRCLNEVDLDSLGLPSKHRLPVTKVGLCEWACPRGHETAFWDVTPFYGQLYLAGIDDLASMDMRGAVMNLFSAWENFVAHAADALLARQGLPNVPTMIRRAEPLLGLYVGLVAPSLNRMPKLVSSDITSVRNKVSHGSLVPTESQALQLGGAVREAILDVAGPCSDALQAWEARPETEGIITKEYRGRYGERPTVPLMRLSRSIDLDRPLEARVAEARQVHGLVVQAAVRGPQRG